MKKRSFSPEHAIENLNVTYAYVTRIVSKENGHYFGFATDVSDDTRKLYFKKQARKSCIHIGPVCLHDENPTAVGDIIMGRLQIMKKTLHTRTLLPTFLWWIGEAAPILYLRDRLNHSISIKKGNDRRSFVKLGHSDDLYVMARVLIYGDVHLVANMLKLPVSKQEVHVSRKKIGYTLRRGYKLNMHPIKFIAILAQFTRQEIMLKIFYNLLGDVELDSESEKLRSIYSLIELSKRT